MEVRVRVRSTRAKISKYEYEVRVRAVREGRYEVRVRVRANRDFPSTDFGAFFIIFTNSKISGLHQNAAVVHMSKKCGCTECNRRWTEGLLFSSSFPFLHFRIPAFFGSRISALSCLFEQVGRIIDVFYMTKEESKLLK